jgi:hypothetical protein
MMRGTLKQNCNVSSSPKIAANKKKKGKDRKE